MTDLNSKHVIVMPNYAKAMLEGTSQLYVQAQYIKALQEEAEQITVLLPAWGKRIVEAWREKCDLDLADDDYELLEYMGNSDSTVLPDGYTHYFGKTDVNEKIIYNFQFTTTVDIMTEIRNPPYSFPKAINHFIGNYEDFQEGSAKFLKRYMNNRLAPTIYNSARSRERALQGKPFVLDEYNQYEDYPVGLGIDCDKINNAVDSNETTNEPPKIIYPGNSILSFKNIEWTIDVLDKVYASGQDFVFKMNLVSFSKSKIPDREYIEINDSKPQEEFWQSGAEANCFICASKEESFGLAYWELSEAGGAGIFRHDNWLEDIAKSNGFRTILQRPYTVKSKDEAVAAVKLAIENPKGFKEGYQERWKHRSICQQEKMKRWKEVVNTIINKLCPE